MNGEDKNYIIEHYKERKRFSGVYAEIRSFLQKNADGGCNEHFHWGRFDWMMAHPGLDVEMLPRIALFRDNSGKCVGVAMFDTDIDEGWYILHSTSEEGLLKEMIEYIVEIYSEDIIIKANGNDAALCMLLENMGFEKQFKESVLEMKLPLKLNYQPPVGFSLTAPAIIPDDYQWRLVIHRGFENEGTFEEPNEELAKAEEYLEVAEYIKVFAMKEGEYISHCGIWYDGGETAYIEPVVTVPEYRGKGLAKAVVYEAMNRARIQGAKRTIVLSDQEFYLRIGMTKSSEVIAWVKTPHPRDMNHG